MRSAVSSLLLLIVFASANAWSAKSPVIRVEAMVGEAVVVFEDIDCPEGEEVRVPTGEVAENNPVTCETVVAISTVSDKVNAVVWAIAAADPDDLEAAAAISTLLAGLTSAEQALVIAVLHNNAIHLGTNKDTIVATIRAIAEVNPTGVSVSILTSAVLDPELAGEVISAALEGGGDVGSIMQAGEAAEQITRDFVGDQRGVGSTGETGGGEDSDVEVTSITDSGPSDPIVPTSINTQVPPGGAIPDAASPE